MTDDEDFELFMAHWEERCRFATNDRADEILAQPDMPTFDVLPNEAVLYGLDGQIEQTVMVHTFHDVLYVPKRQRFRMSDYDAPPSATLPTITYRRIGPQTYQREGP